MRTLSDPEAPLQWIKNHDQMWRLQTMQFRDRYDRTTGTVKKRLPTRIRRFLNGTPVGMIGPVVRYLAETGPYDAPIFNLENVTDEQYYPVGTSITRDAQSKGAGQDATYTIIQDLRLVGDGHDEETITTEASCSSVSETTFHWDENEIIDHITGDQGVVYRITGVTRDAETDLFSYQVVKTTAITQHMDEHTVSSTARGTVSMETYDNVYGSPSSPTYDNVVNGGRAISIPTPAPDNSVKVEVSFQENPDCTFKISVRRTKIPSNADTGEECEKTSFEHQHTKRKTSAAKPTTPHVSEAGNGKTYKKSSALNQDGAWDITESSTTELAQSGAQKSKRKTLRGVITTTVDRNVTNNDTTVSKVGDEVRVEMTPGGKFNRTVTSVEKTPVGQTGADCQTTVFEHAHQKTTNQADRPAEEASSAGGGKTYQKTARQTEEGTWDVTERTTTEKAQATARKVVKKTLRGVVTSTTSRNVSNSSTDVKNVGDEVQVEMTPGGLYNRTVVRISSSPVGKIGAECQATVFEHSHQTTENTSSAPSEEASSAGGGMTHVKSMRQTEEGTWDVTTRTVTEKSQSGAVKVKKKTLRGVITTTTDRNVSSSDMSVSKVGDEVRVEMTPGGLYNRTKTSVENSPAGTIGTDCQQTVFEHSHQTTTNQASEPGADSSSAGGGKTTRKSARRTEEGTWDVTEQTVTEIAKSNARVSERKTARGTIKTVTDRNVTSTGRAPSNVGDAREYDTTPGGRYNVSTTTVTANPGDMALACTTSVLEHQHSTTKTQKNKPDSEATSAGGGKTYQRRARLGDDGLWEVDEVTVTELEKSVKSREYQDALGTVTETKNHNTGSDGTNSFSEGTITSVSREITPGGKKNTVETTETCREADSGWMHFQKTTSDGVMYILDKISFKNASQSQVKSWVSSIQSLSYEAANCSFSNHPSIDVSPNKFGKLDGSVSLVTTATPKNWSGGSDEKDNWSHSYSVEDVSITPINPPTGGSDDKFLKVTTTIEHEMGGGVGYKNFKNAVGTKVQAGSTFNYHPSGQAFSYDLITSRTVKQEIVSGYSL